MAESIVQQAGAAAIPLEPSTLGRRKPFGKIAQPSTSMRSHAKPANARQASGTGTGTGYLSKLVGNSFHGMLSSSTPKVGGVNNDAAAKRALSINGMGGISLGGANNTFLGEEGKDQGRDDGSLVRITPSSPIAFRKGAATSGSTESTPRTPHGTALSVGRSMSQGGGWTAADDYVVLVTSTLAQVSTLVEALEAPQIPPMGVVVVCPLYEWNQEQDREEMRRLRTFHQVGHIY